MKNFKILLFTFILISFNNNIISQQLSMKVYLDKTTYLVSEPVFALGVLKNNGNSEIIIPDFGVYLTNNAVTLKIYDSKGETLPPMMEYKSLHSDSPANLILKPGESFCEVYFISRWYGSDVNKILDSDKYLLEGKYFIQIIFEDLKNHYRVESDIVEFEIITPSAEDDVFAYNLLKEAADYISNDNIEDFKNILNKIIKSENSSDYKLIAYQKLINQLDFENRGKKTDQISSLIEEILIGYPNSLYSYIISSIYWVKDKDIFKKLEVRDRIKKSKYYSLLKHYFQSYNLIEYN